MVPVEVQFLETDLNNYSVVDLSDNSKISTFRKGDRLYFMAKNLPGTGYKQYELVNSPEKTTSESENNGRIENEFYTVSLSGSRLEITDKSSGKNILSSDSKIMPFVPVRKVTQADNGFKTLEGGLKADTAEKNNVFEELTVSYSSDLFRKIKFRLWKNLNRIDIMVSVNLEALKETGRAEEYGLPFALNVPDGKISYETLGGLMSLEDRFPSAGHTSFAVRRVIDIAGNGEHYLVASPDCRIFTYDTTGSKNVLVANVLNNFPKSWNRNEDNTGTVDFRFSIAKAGDKDDITAFGYEACTNPVIRKSWYRKDTPVKEFIKLSNPAVKLISLRPVGETEETYEMVLQNSSADKSESLTISSGELFSSARVSEVNLIGEKLSAIPVSNKSIKFELSPNSINKLTVQKLHN